MANMKKLFYAIKEHLEKIKYLDLIINDASCEHWLCCECLAAINTLLGDNEYVCLEDRKRDISIFKVKRNGDKFTHIATHIIEVKLVYSNNWKDVGSDLKALKKQITKKTSNVKEANISGLVFYIWKSMPENYSYSEFKKKVRQMMGEKFDSSNKCKKFTTQSNFYPTEILAPVSVDTLWLQEDHGVKEREVALLFDYVTCVDEK